MLHFPSVSLHHRKKNTMIAVIFLSILFTEVVVCQSDTAATGEWAPIHGLHWGILNEVQCPNGGMFTGIRYRSTNVLMERLGFYCTSSEGETLIGPFGGENDDTCEDEKCPQGWHVQSIYGRGSAALNAFGITCAEGSQKVQLKLHGGSGGTDYDDASFASKSKRASAINVWYSDNLITAVQAKYSNI